MIENIMTLVMLVMLQAVLGVDNLLYISLESKRAPEHRQTYVRRLGIGIAIVLRIALLFVLVKLIDYFKDPFMHLDFTGIVSGEFNVHSLIVFLGGGFIIYTAIKEIWHMISLEEHNQMEDKSKTSVTRIIVMIVIMNLVFSFDSILSALALTDVLWVMIVAVVIGGIIMIWLADRVANFLKRNRMYEVLGLFILFLVGVMLITEAGHLSHLRLFGNEITAMNKTTFYFILAILILIDIVQGRYHKKLMKVKEAKTINKNL